MHLIGHFYLFASYVLTRLRFFNVHFSQRWNSSSIRLAGWFSVWFNLYLSVLMWWHIGSLAIIIAPADDGTVRNWPKQINTYLENAILKVVCVCVPVCICVCPCVLLMDSKVSLVSSDKLQLEATPRVLDSVMIVNFNVSHSLFIDVCLAVVFFYWVINCQLAAHHKQIIISDLNVDWFKSITLC